ncbi:MAG TPA: hypothetical protein VGW78_07370 [Candidatus Babeliales bacterium]|jgi:hypothetical protein|nr:hypothetical protein [Candidatus Babeliales bacterium]
MGSFDPLHKGHESIIQRALDQKLCDYILVFPEPWHDPRKPLRTTWHIRNEMVKETYKNNPHVLTSDTSDFGSIIAHLQTIQNITVISIIGSDLAMDYIECPEKIIAKPHGWLLNIRQHDLQNGFKIPISIDEILVSVLEGEDLIVTSSTAIRTAIGDCVSLALLPINEQVRSIILKYDLYTKNVLS